MRRISLLLLALPLPLALAACTGGDSNGSRDDDEDTGTADTGAGDTGNGGDSGTPDLPGGGGDTGETPCEYPDAPNTIQYGQVMPNWSWPTATDEYNEAWPFSMEDFYCSPEYDGYESLVIVIGAMWCQPCKEYIKYVGTLEDVFLENGAILFNIEAENVYGDLATTEETAPYLDRLIPGIRRFQAGDGETEPTPGSVRASPIVTAFPSAIVVRRSDMVVIADQSRSEYFLPYGEITAHPEADWSDPPPPPFEPNCTEEQEEASEATNNSPEGAPLIEPGTFEAGICNLDPDFYRIAISGPWRIDIGYSVAIGDIDVYAWDEENNQVLMDEYGQPIGSDSTDDDETFEHEGPALIRVHGYQSSSAPYTLTLTAL